MGLFATAWLTVLIALQGVAAASPRASDRDADRANLLEGVRLVDVPGIPGPVCAIGESAFAVIVGKTAGDGRMPLVVAARHGKGRVVAFGKDGFLDPDSLGIADTGRLVVNAVRWAAGPATAPRVGVIGHRGFADALARRELDATATRPDSLAGLDVLCVSPTRVPETVLPALARFVEEGGGLVVGELGWGWKQLHPGRTLARDFAANTLLGPMGILFADGTLERTAEGGFATGEAPSPLLNASRALDAALAHRSGKAPLADDDRALVSTVLTRTIQVLPGGEASLLPRLEALRGDDSIRRRPTLEQPFEAGDVLERMLMTLDLRRAGEAGPVDVRPHPAAAGFPGAASPGAPRVARTVTIDTRIPGWHSTGLFAGAGERLTVTIPVEATGVGLSLRLGSTTCRNWNRAEWRRAPEVTREFELRSAESVAASAFGGLVYVVVPEGCRAGGVSVTIEGAVEAPCFVLGETTLEEWRKRVRDLPAPRAEFASRRVVLTVPSETIRGLDDPASLLRAWDSILDACAELAGIPEDERVRPQRYVADDQICAGYMHAGNPIMIPTSAAGRLVDRKHLLREGNWGLFHETGHMHQHRDWTFDGTGEVTCNLFTLYVLDRVCGIPPGEGRMAGERIRRAYVEHFRAGSDFVRWRKDPFLALTMYVQLQQAFGWEPFRKVFAEYRALADAERPRDDEAKRDEWMVRFARTVNRDLGPFFEAWGVPTSEAARASIAELPDWLPEGFPPR